MIIVIAVLLFSQFSAASILVPCEFSQKELISSLSMFEGEAFDPKKYQASKNKHDWKGVKISKLPSGISSGRWFSFEIVGGCEEVVEIFFEHFFVLSMDVFRVSEDGGLKKIGTDGNIFPFSSRNFFYRHHLFSLGKIGLKEKLKIVYFAKGHLKRSTFRVKVATLSTIFKEATSDYISFGLLFGVMLFSVFVALIALVAFRDTVYLYFIGNAVATSAALAGLNGLAYQFIWPDLPYVNFRTIPVSVSLIVFFLPLLTLKVFEIGQRQVFFIGCLLSSFGLVMGILNLFFLDKTLMSMSLYLLPICFLVCFFATIFWTVVNPKRQAILYLVSFSTFMIFGSFSFINDHFELEWMKVFDSLLYFGAAIQSFGFGLALLYQAIDRSREQADLLEKANSEVEKERAKNEVASQVSHDIRSPLTALNMFMSTVSHENKERKLADHAISRITEIVDRLKIRKPTTGSPVDWSDEGIECHLSSAVSMIVAEKKLEYKGKTRSVITLNVKGADLFAKISRVELSRVISNLINNSVEALGQSAGHISITVQKEGKFGLISVVDDGPGMSADLITCIHGRQSKSMYKMNGSGLGLTHAKSTIESSGGKLSILSKEEIGTTVQVILPLSSAPRWFASSFTVSSDAKIVVLDEDPSIHEVWKRKLSVLKMQNADLDVVYYTCPTDFISSSSLLKGQKNLMIFSDYYFSATSKTGVELVRECIGVENAVIVTSEYGRSEVRSDVGNAGFKILPKDVVHMATLNFGGNDLGEAGISAAKR